MNAPSSTKTKVESTKVVIAANRYSNGTLLIGLRHWDQHMVLQAEALEKAGLLSNEPCPEQGFLDQYGQFLSREEAWLVAVKVGQPINRHPGDTYGVLQSEHIY